MEKYRKHQTYDVIIPVAKKDCFFLRYVIKYIRINLPEAEQIYIITNKNNIKRVSRYIDKQCLLINEDFLLKGLTYEHTKRLIEDAGGDIKRTGWYFQQLLKYAFSYSKYAKEYYLSWDSDTLPLQHLSFFTDGHPLFTGKAEYHKPYFHTMQRLIGIGKIVNYSFIAEHMIFKCSIVRELLQKIENNSPAKYNWVESIIHACDFAHEVNCFSEFETYGTYCIKFHPNLYKTRTLNTFRGAGLIRGQHINKFIVKKLSIDLQIASFEASQALFPWNIEQLPSKIINKIRSIL